MLKFRLRCKFKCKLGPNATKYEIPDNFPLKLGQKLNLFL